MNDLSECIAHDSRIGPSVQLAGGRYFNLLDPWHSELGIDDIAHGLSHLCRFTGHTKRFYSVAQHSVMVSLIVPPTLALAGLLHDAHEAVIGDMSTPLKNLLHGYREIEREIERSVRSRFGLPGAMHSEVKRADLVMLATERRDLMPDCETLWAIIEGVKPLKEILNPLPPEEARELFMMRYAEIV